MQPPETITKSKKELIEAVEGEINYDTKTLDGLTAIYANKQEILANRINRNKDILKALKGPGAKKEFTLKKIETTNKTICIKTKCDNEAEPEKWSGFCFECWKSAHCNGVNPKDYCPCCDGWGHR